MDTIIILVSTAITLFASGWTIGFTMGYRGRR
jgi:hypothetical protein